MLKQTMTSLVYYIQEMLIFLLVLNSVFALFDTEYASYDTYLWLAFVFVLGLPSLMLLGKKVKKQTHLFYILLPILGLFSFLVWDYGLILTLVLTIIPFWRLKSILDVSLEIEALFRRFLLFVVVLFAAFVFLKVMTFADIGTLMPLFLWLQFGIFLLGVLFYNYVKAKEDRRISFWAWVKNQTFLLCVIVVCGGLPWILPFLMSGVQFLKVIVSGVVVWILSSKPVQAFLYGLMGIELPMIQSEIESTDEEVENGNAEIEELYDQASSIVSVFMVIIIALFLLFVIYLIVLNLFIKPYLERKKEAGELDSTDHIKRERRNRFGLRKKTKWAEDEIRRLYQELLIFAHRKGEPITSLHTARTWGKPYLGQPQTQAIWSRINTVYEQKRYSNNAIKKEEVESFKREIELAKIELNRYYKNKKLESKKDKGE